MLFENLLHSLIYFFFHFRFFSSIFFDERFRRSFVQLLRYEVVHSGQLSYELHRHREAITRRIKKSARRVRTMSQGGTAVSSRKSVSATTQSGEGERVSAPAAAAAAAAAAASPAALEQKKRGKKVVKIRSPPPAPQRREALRDKEVEKPVKRGKGIVEEGNNREGKRRKGKKKATGQKKKPGKAAAAAAQRRK